MELPRPRAGDIAGRPGPGRARAAALLALALLAAGPGTAQARRGRAASRSQLQLDGQPVLVRWSDGDTFTVRSGPRRGERIRLAGVNALEGHGPVHRIGALDGPALLAVAREATRVAAAGDWRCTSRGRDRYRRTLADCPDAARALVSRGLAMVFALSGPADPGLLSAQHAAQAGRAGMWAGGVPPEIPSSLHAAGEPGLAGPAYDRLVDTASGRARTRTHATAYRTCQEVCVGQGARRACMTYVPFERRYRRRPDCLR
jgi:endonuclease YncB( thermonuclease family)